MGRTRKLLCATRGAIFVEQLIAFLPVLWFGLLVWQLFELAVGDLVMRRAASAAARAAVVVLPDDPAFYDVDENSFRGQRKTDIELAAALILATNTHFRRMPQVTIEGEPAGHNSLSVRVEADFECLAGWVNLVCGGARRRLTATAAYPYQGASYEYE